MNERLKSYINVLQGKQNMEMYVNAFDNQSCNAQTSNVKYDLKVNENEKFNIYSFTKMNNYKSFNEDRYSFKIMSIYSHKEKNLIILKMPVIFFNGYYKKYNDNILWYLKYLSKKHNVRIIDFSNDKTINNVNEHQYHLIYKNIKVILDENVNDENLINFILTCEFLDKQVKEKDKDIWDNYNSIVKNIECM